VNKEFGQTIRQARKDKSYSQRDLAKLLGLDFTYLSKLENNRAEYAPKEDVIRAWRGNWDLDAEELIFMAGRIPQKEEDLLRQHHKSLPALFRRLRESPEFAEKVFQEASQDTLE
jgi:transcriptional regulator with XRE-family HTH domain